MTDAKRAATWPKADNGDPTTLICGGQVYDPLTGTAFKADILIAEGEIREVGAELPQNPDWRMIDAQDRLVIPGLINSHTHSHNNLMRGAAEGWTLEDLRNFGPALYSDRSPEDQYLSAAIGAVEMLKTGCTAAYDQFAAIPVHTDEGTAAVIQAYEDVGMRAVVAPAVADIPFYRAVPDLLDFLPRDLRRAVEEMGSAPSAEMLVMNRNAVKRWDGSAGGRIRLATAPLIPGECSDELLSGCRDIVLDFGVTLHTHLAETKIQAVAAQRRWGESMVVHLSKIGLLSPNFVGGHGVWITDRDIAVLSDHGAKITYNAASNMRLGSGLAPIREMLDAGVTVSVATDGSMASDNQNMFEAMRIGCLLSAVRFPQQPDRWLDAATMIRLATIHGASVLGQSDRLGRIAPGYRADLVLLRTDRAHFGLKETIANQLVFANSGHDVERVLVEGKLVVDAGKVLGIDEAGLHRKAAEATERLRACTDHLWSRAVRMQPFLRQACAKCASHPFPVNRWSIANHAED